MKMSTFLQPVPDVCNAYFELYDRVSQLVSGLPEIAALSIVPHCPQWTVKDVLSHMIGVPEDILSGTMEGVTTDAWTKRQVDRHTPHNFKELLEIWEEAMNTFRHLLPKIPQPTISQFVFDQATHEHDIRHALSSPGARESTAITVAEGFLREYLSRNPDPEISSLARFPLTGFEFVRSLSGRRSLKQITAIGLPANAVEAFISTSPFVLPTETVEE